MGQQKIPVPISFNDLECDIIQTEIDNLLAKEIIIEPICKDDDNDEYISNIFVRPKKNGKFRIILNLRNLNDCVEYHHFKMETLKTAISLVSKNCYFGSIDLQDAYTHVLLTQMIENIYDSFGRTKSINLHKEARLCKRVVHR